MQAERLTLLREDPSTAPKEKGVLVIDETGDRKDGEKTAHVARQYLENRGKIENRVVSVTSLWADERVYYPLEVEPYTPESSFARGKNDPELRTKRNIALQLVQQAVEQGWPFRAVVADTFYGEDRGLKRGGELKVPYVMALKPSHAWDHPANVAGTLQDVAHEAGWVSAEQPGQWVGMKRTFRDGSTQDWWAVEIVAGPYGPGQKERAIVASTDPRMLPDLSTWYLVTNLPPSTDHAESEPLFPPASLEEILRLYGLHMWVEQSYKQIKHAASLVPLPGTQRQSDPTTLAARLLCLLVLLLSCQSLFLRHGTCHSRAVGITCSCATRRSCSRNRGEEKNQRGKRQAATSLLAARSESGTRLVGALDHAAALLAWLVATAPASGVTTPAPTT